MYLYQPEFHILLHPLWIVTWKLGWACVALCVSQSPYFCSRTLFRMYICIVHVLMSIWLPILAWPPLHSYIETWVPLCSTVCVYQALHIWYHTLVRMCTCISTCTYVYLTPHVCITALAYLYGNMGSSVWHCEYVAVIPPLVPHLGYYVYMHQCMYLCQPDSPCLLQPLWVVTYKHGFLCVALCVCCSHPTSGPTPWLECVYRYVHAFMLKWIPMSPQIPMHSLMETWVPCIAQCMFSSHLISVPIPCLECVHASVHVFMYTNSPC